MVSLKIVPRRVEISGRFLFLDLFRWKRIWRRRKRKENCKRNVELRVSFKRSSLFHGRQRMYMARNDEFTLERAKPRYLSAPVRSISVTAAYLSAACRLKIPPPLPPTAIIGRRLIYGLIEKNTKFLPPSSVRGGNAEALRAREVRLERERIPATNSICISRRRRRIPRVASRESSKTSWNARFYRLRACSIRDDSNSRAKLQS